jgi:hypothetical protein
MNLSDQESLIHDMSPFLDKFKKKRNGLNEMRCPLCGDSKKSKYKTRGNIFLFKGSYIYKCHNCGVSLSLFTFAKMCFPDIFSRHCFSFFSSQKEEEEINSLFSEAEKKKILSSSFPFLLPYSSSEKAKAYIKERKIPRDKCSDVLFIEDLNLLISAFPDSGYNQISHVSPRLVFPIHSKDSSLVGFVTRAIEKNDPIRYYNIKVSPDGVLLSGQRTIDHSKRVYITEGHIDSLFLDNGMGACSSGFRGGIEFCKKNKLDYTLVFDNEPRNSQIKSNIEKYIDEGESIVIFSSFPFKGKDLNRMILLNEGINIQEEIKKRTYQGLLAKLEFNRWLSQNLF